MATHESEGEDGNLAPSDGEDSNVSVIFLFIFHNYEYNLIYHRRQNFNCNLFRFHLGLVQNISSDLTNLDQGTFIIT